ncbi:hypothetical protein KAJ27_04020 [bacterium]|nr:hypothetical protein [bacterium]
MFKPGDAVVHPSHGAGYIYSIEDRSVAGENKKYYKIAMITSSLQYVMVPVDYIEKIGIRKIHDETKIDALLNTLNDDYNKEISYTNWNEFNRLNIARLRSGNLYEVVKLYKILKTLGKSKKLGIRDTEMLSKAKLMLISELIACKNISYKDAETLLKTA